MASAAVFGTYELLEQILLHLPVKDLLLSQGVAKGWHDMVQRSQGARRALFSDDSFTVGAYYTERHGPWHMDCGTGVHAEHALRPLINPLLNDFSINEEEGIMSSSITAWLLRLTQVIRLFASSSVIWRDT